MIQKTTTFRGSLEPDAFTLSSCHFFIVVIVYLYLYFYFPLTPRIGPIFCIFITLIFFTRNWNLISRSTYRSITGSRKKLKLIWKVTSATKRHIWKVRPKTQDCWWGLRIETRDPSHRWDPGPEPGTQLIGGIRHPRPRTLKVGPETWDPENSESVLSFLWSLAFMDEFMCFMRLCLFCMFLVTLS